MRLTRIVGGLVGVLLLTAACAAQPGGTPAPPPLPGMTPVPVADLAAAPAAAGAPLALTAEQVSAALLSPADVPADWTSDPQGAATEAGVEAAGSATWTPATCRDLGMAGSPGAGDLTDGIQFITPDRHVVVELITSWQGDAATSLIGPTQAFAAGCPTITLTMPNGVTVTEHLAPAPVPAVGEQTAGILIDAGAGDVRSQSYQAAVTVGHVSVTVVATGTSLMDQALIDQLITTAVAKVTASS